MSAPSQAQLKRQPYSLTKTYERGSILDWCRKGCFVIRGLYVEILYTLAKNISLTKHKKNYRHLFYKVIITLGSHNAYS